ncbi:MAG: hypothetical protein U0800_00325 [Isosphaeraceae bacterium]
MRSGHSYLKMSVANYGDMVFQLFDDLAPRRWPGSALVNQGFYHNG